MLPSTHAHNPSDVMARSVDCDGLAHTLVLVQPHSWMIRLGTWPGSCARRTLAVIGSNWLDASRQLVQHLCVGTLDNSAQSIGRRRNAPSNAETIFGDR